jgi:hypothetical protein
MPHRKRVFPTFQSGRRVITLGAERGRFLFFQWLAATFELSLKNAADGANGGGGAAAGERDYAAKKLQPATHVALIARSTTRFANTHSKTPSSLLSTLSRHIYAVLFQGCLHSLASPLFEESELFMHLKASAAIFCRRTNCVSPSFIKQESNWRILIAT